MADGVVPQSSCSFNPQTPDSTCSINASSLDAFPFPKNPKFTGNSSADCNILDICQGPGVHVVALVPSAGPVPPPNIVVIPELRASSIC